MLDTNPMLSHVGRNEQVHTGEKCIIVVQMEHTNQLPLHPLQMTVSQITFSFSSHEVYILTWTDGGENAKIQMESRSASQLEDLIAL